MVEFESKFLQNPLVSSYRIKLLFGVKNLIRLSLDDSCRLQRVGTTHRHHIQNWAGKSVPKISSSNQLEENANKSFDLQRLQRKYIDVSFDNWNYCWLQSSSVVYSPESNKGFFFYFEICYCCFCFNLNKEFTRFLAISGQLNTDRLLFLFRYVYGIGKMVKTKNNLILFCFHGVVKIWESHVRFSSACGYQSQSSLLSSSLLSKTSLHPWNSGIAII